MADCIKLAQEYEGEGQYQLLERSNGIVWLCPQEPHYAGHSLWRILQSKVCERAHDYETANWFLAHPRVTDGPETRDNTNVPTERPLASLQYDG